jgi:poly-gamma-glutamate synthesis protein (capsule biosynthesis protein)
VKLFLCGDVMTGRGIDQILPSPSSPQLHEPYVKSALEYVELAEHRNGPIPRPVDFSYIWGDAIEELRRRAPDLRVVNLETSVTTSEDPLLKGINYRMHPDNVGCLQAAGIDCCVLANNHVLDWGRAGLSETLASLAHAGITTVGAGEAAYEAARPAVFDTAAEARVLVFAFGSTSGGIPPDWAATVSRPGVVLLPDLTEGTAAEVAYGMAVAEAAG